MNIKAKKTNNIETKNVKILVIKMKKFNNSSSDYLNKFKSFFKSQFEKNKMKR